MITKRMLKTLKKLLKNTPKLYETEEKVNPLTPIHFFNILGRGDWYVTEAREEKEDILFYGYCKSPLGEDCDEWGYFTLSQLKNAKFIELDLFFKPQPIKGVI